MRAYTRFTGTLIAAVLAGLCFTGCGMSDSDKADLKDFTADVSAVDDKLKPYGATWETEQESRNSYSSHMEMLVKVDGCIVELERTEDAEATKTVDGRKIETYTFDEVQHKDGDEVSDLTESTLKSNPDAKAISNYLADNREQLKFCLAS